MNLNTNFLNKSLKRFPVIVLSAVVCSFCWSGIIGLFFFLTPLAVSAQVTLPALDAGEQMTCQFVNNSTYANNQVYILVLAGNSAGTPSYLNTAGAMVPVVAGQNCSSYSLTLAQIAALPGGALQFPTVMTSGRIWISYGVPMNMPINPGPGIVQPNIANPTDPNINTIFDWIEFNVGGGQVFFNTTQVNMFGIPYTMGLYSGTGVPYTSNGAAGITQCYSNIVTEYEAYMNSIPGAAIFNSLVGSVRIVAPVDGSFAAGQPNGNYFDSYIASVWGTYGNGGATPSTQDVFGATGSLATDPTTDAALNRHVLSTPAEENIPADYYQAGPANYYAAFWHTVNLNNLAYGFPYDDDNNQSDLLVSTSNPRGLAVTLSGCPPTPTNTPTNTFSSTATNTATVTDTRTFTSTATNTFTNTNTSTATNTFTHTATSTFTSTATNTATATSTNMAVNTATASATKTVTNTDTSTSTNSPTGTSTSSPTASCTNTCSQTATNTSINTNTITNTPTHTVTSTYTNTMTNTATSTFTLSNTPSFTDSATATNSSTTTAANTFTATSTLTNTNTTTPQATATSTNTLVLTATYTGTPSSTASSTATASLTLTVTETHTFSPTSTLTDTATNTVTQTRTTTAEATSTFSSTVTSTLTSSKTATQTLTPTMTPPGTFTPTPTSIPDKFFISKNVFTGDSPVQIQVSISQVPGHYDLTIYNSAGEHIKTMDSMYLDSAFSKTYYWDGTNSFGNKCGSGVYVIYLTEPFKRLIGRVVLIH